MTSDIAKEYGRRLIDYFYSVDVVHLGDVLTFVQAAIDEAIKPTKSAADVEALVEQLDDLYDEYVDRYKDCTKNEGQQHYTRICQTIQSFLTARYAAKDAVIGAWRNLALRYEKHMEEIHAEVMDIKRIVAHRQGGSDESH